MNTNNKLLLLVALVIVVLIVANGLLSVNVGMDGPVAIGIGNPKALSRLTPTSFVEGFSAKLRSISGPKGNRNNVYLGGSSKDPGFLFWEGEYRGIAPLWNGTNYRDLANMRCKNSSDSKCGKVSEEEYFNMLTQ